MLSAAVDDRMVIHQTEQIKRAGKVLKMVVALVLLGQVMMM